MLTKKGLSLNFLKLKEGERVCTAFSEVRRVKNVLEIFLFTEKKIIKVFPLKKLKAS